MRREFLDFLVNEDVISREQADGFHQTLRTAPEPIGAIAFSYGMITGAQIDEVLDEQRNDARPFGEIAIAKGLLKPDQVSRLLFVQRIRAATETAEALALSGTCAIDEIMAGLGRFLSSAPAEVLSAG